jgi:hypothetical protein
MMPPEENSLFQAVIRNLDTNHRERLLHVAVQHSVPVAVQHVYSAKDMGHSARPWYRCLQGTLAFIRMHSTMAERLGTPYAIDLLPELNQWYQQLLDLQEMS